MRSQIAWWGALLAGLAVQSIFLAPFVPDGWRPDVTRALVLWIALTGRPSGGVWYAFAAGTAVDVVSGAPLGFTAFLRVSIYAFARPARGVLEHSPIVFILGPVSVALETLLVLAISSLSFTNPITPANILLLGVKQALLEVAVVPVVFVLMELASGYRTEWGVKLDSR